jgi:hypothetical protein
MARAHTPAAMKTLVDVMNDADAPAEARISAAIAILDRGWGKPAQQERPAGDETAGPIEIRWLG